MLTTQWRQRLRKFTAARPASARRRTTRRRPVTFDAPAEVLESRQLLTVPLGVPYLAFAVQPSNAVAGHGLSFTVDVMINERSRPTGNITSQIDTAYNGIYTGVPTGPQSQFNEPFDYFVASVRNLPITQWVSGIVNGVGKLSADFLSLDTAGTYTVTITAPAFPQLGAAGVTGSVTSKPFTISPFTATDHLVFTNVNGSEQVFAVLPFSVTIAVEDEYGNIDPGVSNVPITVLAAPGSSSTVTLMNGQGTLNDVFFAQPGQGVLLALGAGGPNGFLFSVDLVTVLPLPIAN